MKVAGTNILNFLNGEKQFVIPIYQRTYSWKTPECQQLWEDIVRVSDDSVKGGHFIGSIVYVQDDDVVIGGGVTQFLVIDGQQRLTTIVLLLSALGAYIAKTGNVDNLSKDKINNLYVFNQYEKGDGKYKLLLTQGDRDALKRALDGLEPLPEASRRIVENYNYFLKQITGGQLSPIQIFNGIGKLLLVSISLERTADDPQLIFESLNSKGMDLSKADLIRNFMLMGLKPEEQEKLYNSYWHPMEKLFDNSEEAGIFDAFMRDYLTMKTGNIPSFPSIYREFKDYTKRHDNSGAFEIIKDLYRYSKYYTNMAYETEEDKEINDAFTDINTLEVYTSYPFLLRVYDDYANKSIGKQEFIDAIRLVESYVFRRFICGIPTNSLNKTFSTLYKKIDRADYIGSLKNAFMSMEGYRRFPDDQEFTSEFLVKDIYHTYNCKYLLTKIENPQHKEQINPEDYTIEHIMPQNEDLSEAWQKDLGPNWKEVQDKYLHTIGNLTLTGCNSEMSDLSFIEKRDITCGFKNSQLWMNRPLSMLGQWNETEILKRSKDLTEMAVVIWKMPEVTTVNLTEDEKPLTDTQEIISYIFPSGEDYIAAKLLARDIVTTIGTDKIKMVTVTFNGYDTLYILVGRMRALGFIRYPEALYTGFTIDLSLIPKDEQDFSDVVPIPTTFKDGKDLNMVWMEWGHDTRLSSNLIDSWHVAIRHACNKFKDRNSSTNSQHKPLLAEALLKK